MENPSVQKTHPPRGRPRQFDEATVLAAMMETFWSKGYEGTSVSDLETATGLLKGSLYAAFGSKSEMYTRALDYYEQEVVDAGCAILASAEDADAALRNFMNAPSAALASGDVRGCFLCNASADRAASDLPTRDMVERGYAKLRRAIAEALMRTRKGLDIETAMQRAALLLTTYSGLRVMSRSQVEAGLLDAARDVALEAALGT